MAGVLQVPVRVCGSATAPTCPWVEQRRRELGGSGIGAAERSGRAIVESAPFRESGHVLLMEALAARGDVAEALRLRGPLLRAKLQLVALEGGDVSPPTASATRRRARWSTR